MYNKQHVLHPTLPGTMDTKYHLMPRDQNFKLMVLTTKNRLIPECDFITRMLFKDVYWHYARYMAILCICIPFLHVSSFISRYFSTQWHTHIHLTALFSGLPGSVGTRKEKPIWILLKQETWVAVASAGPYATLHIAPNKQISYIETVACRVIHYATFPWAVVKT